MLLPNRDPKSGIAITRWVTSSLTSIFTTAGATASAISAMVFDDIGTPLCAAAWTAAALGTFSGVASAVVSAEAPAIFSDAGCAPAIVAVVVVAPAAMIAAV